MTLVISRLQSSSRRHAPRSPRETVPFCRRHSVPSTTYLCRPPRRLRVRENTSSRPNSRLDAVGNLLFGFQPFRVPRVRPHGILNERNIQRTHHVAANRRRRGRTGGAELRGPRRVLKVRLIDFGVPKSFFPMVRMMLTSDAYANSNNTHTQYLYPHPSPQRHSKTKSRANYEQHVSCSRVDFVGRFQIDLAKVHGQKLAVRV